MRETLKRNAAYKVTGAAWTGDADVTKVEFSSDAGKTWAETTLLGNPVRFAWRLWVYQWTPTQSGPAVIMTRATDSRGNVQPPQHNPDTANYAIHHTLPIDVEVI